MPLKSIKNRPLRKVTGNQKDVKQGDKYRSMTDLKPSKIKVKAKTQKRRER